MLSRSMNHAGRKLPTRRRAIGLTAVGLSSVPSWGQEASLDRVSDIRPRIPPALRPLADAIGPRGKTAGLEQMVLAGDLDSDGAVTRVRAVFGIAGGFRLDPAAGGISIGFDRASPWSAAGSVTETDGDLLESLAGDSVEGFLSAVARGDAYRPLGERFRADGRLTPDAQAPLVDVYLLGTSARQRGGATPRAKLFMFDSRTKLLRKVRYRVGSPGSETVVETTFDDWREVAGGAVPHRVARTENARKVFEFSADSAVVQPSQGDVVFRRP